MKCQSIALDGRLIILARALRTFGYGFIRHTLRDYTDNGNGMGIRPHSFLSTALNRCFLWDYFLSNDRYHTVQRDRTKYFGSIQPSKIPYTETAENSPQIVKFGGEYSGMSLSIHHT